MRGSILAALVGALCGCQADPTPVPSGEEVAADSARVELPVTERHERLLTFITPSADSTLSVHLAWDAKVRDDRIDRRIEGFLARSGVWERFTSSSWSTDPVRAPWRILPRRPVRVLMGTGDVLERVLYASGSRSLELIPGSTLAEWSGNGGEVIRVQEAEVVLAGRPVSGLLLDFSRSRSGSSPPAADWAILSSTGPRLQLVLEDPFEAGVAGRFRGWAHVDSELLQWPELEVSWIEQRPFESARRDIPAGWRIRSPDGELEGELTALPGPFLEAGGGTGPLLPVRALFEVEGELRIDGERIPVRGLWRHLQP
jgi:hypothetical protein